MENRKLTEDEILELCVRLTEAEAALLEFYSQSNPPAEITEAFARASGIVAKSIKPLLKTLATNKKGHSLL